MTARSAAFRLIPALLAVLPLAAASICEVSSYGATGRQLPVLVRDAIKVFPQSLPVGGGASVPLDRPITPEDVVFIRDFDRFTACQSLTNPSQVEFLRRWTRMFVLRASFPIYISADRRDIQGAIDQYADGAWHVRFQFAAWLGHEVAHAFLHEEGETVPLAAELELQLLYVRQGSLPADSPYIRETLERLEAAKRAASSARPLYGMLLSARGRD